MAAVGIQLGTANSRVGCYIDPTFTIIPNKTGRITTPSQIAMENGKLLILSDEITAKIIPQDAVHDVTQLTGFDTSSVCFRTSRTKGKIQVTKAELSFYLNQLRGYATDYLKTEAVKVVITVPVRYKNEDRTLVSEAALSSGFRSVRIVSEPFAAVIPYLKEMPPTKGEKRILFFNLGKNTLDLSILKVQGPDVELLASNLVEKLGGETIDEILVQHCLKAFWKKHRFDLVDRIRGESGIENMMRVKRIHVRLHSQCSKEKIHLGADEPGHIHMDGIYGNKSLTVDITPSDFRELIKSFIQACLSYCEDLIKEAALSIRDMDHVLLCGGSSQILFLQESLAGKFGRDKILKSINPNVVIAQGAAMLAIEDQRAMRMVEKPHNKPLEGPILGIDLGTSNCCIAICHSPDQFVVIRNSLDKEVTPSYVRVEEDGDFLVGQVAKHQAHQFPETTLYDTKRMWGQDPNNPNIVKFRRLWPFQVNERAGELVIECQEKTFKPQEITTVLVKALKSYAEEYTTTPVQYAVVAAPVYFTSSQQKLLVHACERAGLKVHQLVSEPAAAALAYQQHFFSRQIPPTQSHAHNEPFNCLTFDMGGGILDLSIFQVHPNNGHIEIKSTDGDPQLGGDDIDEEMIHHCIQQFKKATGVDLHSRPRDRDMARKLHRLKRECESTKCYFATPKCKQFPVTIDAMDGDHPLNCNFTRELFNSLVQKHLRSCERVIDRILAKSGLQTSSISYVLLVGGSSRAECIQDMLKKKFPESQLLKHIQPDHAVARGAAFLGYMRLHPSCGFSFSEHYSAGGE